MPRDTDPTSRAVDVDWDDPRLQELLKKTEGLRLDNRNTFAARWVRFHLGWHLGAAVVTWQPALLVWDDHQGGLVLQTRTEAFQVGDPVAVDLAPQGMGARTVFGEVRESRPGLRPEDQGQAVFFTKIQVLR